VTTTIPAWAVSRNGALSNRWRVEGTMTRLEEIVAEEYGPTHPWYVQSQHDEVLGLAKCVRDEAAKAVCVICEGHDRFDSPVLDGGEWVHPIKTGGHAHCLASSIYAALGGPDE
jgi:hypothetical protein